MTTRKTDEQLISEIEQKFGQKHLKSEHIFVQLSPKHLDALRRKGTKLAHGWYSLEEVPTPLPDTIKTRADHGKGVAQRTRVEAVSGTHQARVQVKATTQSRSPTASAVSVPKRTSYHDLKSLRDDFELVGIKTLSIGSGVFSNEFGTFAMAHGVLYMDNESIDQKKLSGMLVKK